MKSGKKRLENEHTCLKMVLVPDPSNPNNSSFWTPPCSQYLGTDLPEKVVGSSFGTKGFPCSTGSENNEQMKRVDACLPKVKCQQYKIQFHT